MEYQDAIDFLFPLHRFGIRPGLDRVRALLAGLGHPERRLGIVVHIAGTNGKGTVAACIASIFQAAGMRTGLFTSPHLVDFTERMRIDGRQISRSTVAAYCERLKKPVLDEGATFFEATTAMALAWFADEGVHASVIETGMGGRLDATNALKGDIVVIPSIGLDHTAWLGETIAAIAAEKAAIIKPGSRVFTGVVDPEALAPIRDAAARCASPLHLVEPGRSFRVADVRPGRLDIELMVGPGDAYRLSAPLTGSFHATNVALAALAARSAGISQAHVDEGIASLQRTGYRGRLEFVGEHPAIVIDVSHNPAGMEKTVAALREIRSAYRKLHLLVGIASDKDAEGIVRQLAGIADTVVAVPLPSERSLPPGALALLFADAGVEEVRACGSASEGFSLLAGTAASDDMVLVTGSFFLAGELMAEGRWPEQPSSLTGSSR